MKSLIQPVDVVCMREIRRRIASGYYQVGELLPSENVLAEEFGVGRSMIGKALCLPETIGSTTGGMVLYTACAMGKQPACMLFSKPIDSLAASGAILAANWTDAVMPVVDSLGEEFLEYVKDGMMISVSQDGTITVEG